jgi:hypothetical protein
MVSLLLAPPVHQVCPQLDEVFAFVTCLSVACPLMAVCTAAQMGLFQVAQPSDIGAMLFLLWIDTTR